MTAILADSFDYVALADRYGILGLILIGVLWSGYKGAWVWGSQLKAAEKREADWRDMAIRGTLIAERAAGREKWTVEERLGFLEQLQERRRPDD